MKQLVIQLERIKRGWTLQYVGEQVGITKQSYRAIEIGATHPSYIVLCKLEDLFQMPHRELLAQIGEAEDKLRSL